MNENDFLNIEELKWFPWVGDSYKNNPVKILIVGESHYDSSNDLDDKLGQMINDKEYTRNIIKVWAIHSIEDAQKLVPKKINVLTQQPMFANLHRAIGINNNDTERLWENVAFYNFIQRPMKNLKKDRPSKNDFIKGWKVLFKLLDILTPDYCLFIGTTSANFLNNAIPKNMERIKISYKKLDKKKYSKIARLFEIGKTKCISIQHTSHHFSHEKWRNFLSDNEFSQPFINEISKYRG